MGSPDYDAWVAATFGAHPNASASVETAPHPAARDEVRKPAPALKPIPRPSLLDPNNPTVKAAVEKAAERQKPTPMTTPGPAKGKTEADDKGQSPADAARGPGPHVGDDNPLGEAGIDIPLGPVTVRPSTDGTSVGGVTVTIPLGGPKKKH